MGDQSLTTKAEACVNHLNARRADAQIAIHRADALLVAGLCLSFICAALTAFWAKTPWAKRTTAFFTAAAGLLSALSPFAGDAAAIIAKRETRLIYLVKARGIAVELGRLATLAVVEAETRKRVAGRQRSAGPTAFVGGPTSPSLKGAKPLGQGGGESNSPSPELAPVGESYYRQDDLHQVVQMRTLIEQHLLACESGVEMSGSPVNADWSSAPPASGADAVLQRYSQLILLRSDFEKRAMLLVLAPTSNLTQTRLEAINSRWERAATADEQLRIIWEDDAKLREQVKSLLSAPVSALRAGKVPSSSEVVANER